MIYTLTLNPAIDYFVNIDEFILHKTNRSYAETLRAGGKGINISQVLNNLNIKNKAICLIAGNSGEMIKKDLISKKIDYELINIKKGFNRINLKILNYDGTEINGSGPIVSVDEKKQLFNSLNKLNEGDLLFLSGSIPNGLNTTIYKEIIDFLSSKGIIIALDSTNESLKQALSSKPFIIKPNKDEVEEIFNTKINNSKELVNYTYKLKEMGARNVLVSYGGHGSLLITEDNQLYMALPPKGKVINSVGAGDSMLAGFMIHYLKHKDYKEAFKYSIACGSASAFSEEFLNEEKINELIDKVVIKDAH